MKDAIVKKISPTEMERLINKLNGVILSKVNVDAFGEITEVHVLTNLGRSPKQIVRDVQSLAATSFNVAMEHRVISVAQIADDGMVEIGIRLKIRDFDVAYSSNKVTMTVALEGYDKTAQGSSTGMNTSSCRNLTVARACIAALHDYLGKDCLFDVVDLQRNRIAGYDSVSVAVAYLDDGNEQILIGSSVIREDEYNAILCATLDAVNRITNRLLKNWHG